LFQFKHETQKSILFYSSDAVKLEKHTRLL